jgi:competence protein ComEC
LILPVPPLERFFFGLLQRWLNTQQVGLAMALLSELLIVTLAAQISTGPLVIYHFGRLSLVSLLTNLLILPVQPAIMIVGGVAMLAGMVWLPLGEVLGWLVWLPLAWMVWVVEVTAGLPYAALDFGEVPLWLVGLLYGVIGAGVWAAEQPQGDDGGRPAFRLPRLGSPTTLLVVAGLSVAALLLWLAVLARPDGRLHVVFLDVGQGDAILITTPEGRQMLVDGGPSTTTLNWRLGQEMPFWDHSLDVVAVTHPDADHLAGLLSLPGRYEIGQVLMSVPGETALYQEWVAQLAEAQLTPATGTAGMRLSLGKGITATILSPPPDGADGGDKLNNHSLVLRLEYGQISFLLPGDIEQPVERRLVGEAAPLAATVLKVPHHGSSTSSSRSFLTAVDPQLCVISVGQENLFGHPTTETLARLAAQGCDLLQTAEQGTIEFSTDGQRLWVETTR